LTGSWLGTTSRAWRSWPACSPASSGGTRRKDVLADIERWRARGEKFALATVVATGRSAPRPTGSKLAISESGEMAGSVSGGCVESDVYDHACEVLAGAQPQLLSYGIADELAFSVGLPCGGEIDIFVERTPDELVDRLLRDRDAGARRPLHGRRGRAARDRAARYRGG
jgi:xanthine/CO dehydrogenase XdhC/CoxF family maturation factor